MKMRLKMKQVRVILFLLVITLFAASIPGTPLSPVYKHSTASADPAASNPPQEGTGGGRGKDSDCSGIWVWWFGWYCYVP